MNGVKSAVPSSGNNRCQDSRKPRPMMSRIASGERVGKPSCAIAAVAAATMWPVESISVPSQSKTTSRVRLAMVGLQVREHLAQILGQRRGKHLPLAADWILPADRSGMQKQPLQAELAQLPVVIPIPVALVTRQRMAGLCRLHPDLVRAPRH